MNPLAPILANVAVPVLFPQPWLMLLAANLVSTLCGLPVAWCALGVFGMLLGNSDPNWAHLGWSSRLVTHELHNWWILPAAMMAVVIPCFLLSVLVEGWFLAWRVKLSGWTELWSPLVRAHVFSYLLLLAVDCLWFWLKLPR